MLDDNVDKQMEMITCIRKAFEDVAKAAKVDLKDVLDYRDEQSFVLFLSAFNKDKIEVMNVSICSVNTSFRKKCDEFRDKIFKEAITRSEKKYFNLN